MKNTLIGFVLGFIFAIVLVFALVQAMDDPLTTMQKTSAVPASACYRVMT